MVPSTLQHSDHLIMLFARQENRLSVQCTVSRAQMAFTCAVRKNTHPQRTIPSNIFSLQSIGPHSPQRTLLNWVTYCELCYPSNSNNVWRLTSSSSSCMAPKSSTHIFFRARITIHYVWWEDFGSAPLHRLTDRDRCFCVCRINHNFWWVSSK